MASRTKTLCLFLGGILLTPQVLAHSEHDKARFVSATGQDKGGCDNPLRPCKSLAYAISRANKGDRVLVAEGEYQLQNADEVFLMTSDIVPILGGYNRVDHFMSQAPELNQTLLTGVPAQFADKMRQRGFRVAQDGIGQHFDEVNAKLQLQSGLAQNHGSAACSNGSASGFACHNIGLVAHMALGSFSSKPTLANDIWGHVDLNTGTEYAIIGLKNGTAVVSLANPATPVEVGTIAGSSTTWRDIKVLQRFNSQTLRWNAYAYVSSEASNNIQIIDLNNLPLSVSLAATDSAAVTAHNLYISHVDYTTNTALNGMSPLMHLTGQNSAGGAFQNFDLTSATTLQALDRRSNASREDYTHDASSMVIADGRAQASCQTSVCTVLMDFNEASMRLWNISDPRQSKELADVSYAGAQYVHSGWWSEDKNYIFVHDELDEMRNNINTTLRVFKLDDLNAPQLVKEWTGPTPAIDHNGYVRGNRYYMSNYQRGVTVLDISTPDNPKEVGFFDTFPASNSNAFNGVWGVYPYLPSGLILASDINSGLYILSDDTKTSPQGQLSFAQPQSRGRPGDVFEVKVARPEGSGAVSVQWELLEGSAISGVDFQQDSGTLSWDASDKNDKLIQITTLDSGKNQALSAWVKLFNPTGGATLASPSYHSINLDSAAGKAGFAVQSIDAKEGTSLMLQVQRSGGSFGVLTVNYRIENGTAVAGADMEAVSGELQWNDGDTTSKSIQINLLDDDKVEGDETFKVILSADNQSVLGTRELLVTLKDNDRSNSAPAVSAGEDRQVNAGQTVTLNASASDPDGDNITYQWQQTSGTSVSITNATQAQASFVAPSDAGTLSFTITATDALGASSQDAVTFTVVAASTPTTPTTTSGGGGALGSLGLGVLMMFGLTRRQTKPRI